MTVDFVVGKIEQHPKLGQVIVPALGFDHPSCMNISNEAAAMLLRKIGITDYEIAGTLTSQQARQIADLIEEDLSNVQGPSESRGAGGCKIIDMGMSLDRLRRYAYGLNQLADLAEQEETYLVSYA